AGFRYQCPQGRGGSSPLLRTKRRLRAPPEGALRRACLRLTEGACRRVAGTTGGHGCVRRSGSSSPALTNGALRSLLRADLRSAGSIRTPEAPTSGQLGDFLTLPHILGLSRSHALCLLRQATSVKEHWVVPRTLKMKK